jgi:hypothetical protein
MVKTQIMVEEKLALQRLLRIDDYKREEVVAIYGVWDVIRMVGTGSGNPDKEEILAKNLIGTEDEVRKFAQEAFGFRQGGLRRSFELVPAKTKMAGLIHVATILRECGISGKPIPNYPDE